MVEAAWKCAHFASHLWEGLFSLGNLFSFDSAQHAGLSLWPLRGSVESKPLDCKGSPCIGEIFRLFLTSFSFRKAFDRYFILSHFIRDLGRMFHNSLWQDWALLLEKLGKQVLWKFFCFFISQNLLNKPNNWVGIVIHSSLNICLRLGLWYTGEISKLSQSSTIQLRDWYLLFFNLMVLPHISSTTTNSHCIVDTVEIWGIVSLLTVGLIFIIAAKKIINFVFITCHKFTWN